MHDSEYIVLSAAGPFLSRVSLGYKEILDQSSFVISSGIGLPAVPGTVFVQRFRNVWGQEDGPCGRLGECLRQGSLDCPLHQAVVRGYPFSRQSRMPPSIEMTLV